MIVRDSRHIHVPWKPGDCLLGWCMFSAEALNLVIVFEPLLLLFRFKKFRHDALNPGNNLYVTGLSTRVNEKDLEEHFSREGKVLECRLVLDPRTRESRGFGFVTMEHLEDAERCIKYLNRSTLEGRMITVEKPCSQTEEEAVEVDFDEMRGTLGILLSTLLIPEAATGRLDTHRTEVTNGTAHLLLSTPPTGVEDTVFYPEICVWFLPSSCVHR
ncbi:hypothetical protein AXG93_3437s1030 [Marchantia polymorpha subsp. ruderalis]|uniref:RRM domain-containing protein n=1 Tax=Marchantia polymorpha subsp. ruderalis TaxID=1480154 RepID=A0A176W0S2_MARPO|nr:hypothetical protein AXG93_3437s1030 [Marchantia polymorpha subsp. ruderalis]